MEFLRTVAEWRTPVLDKVFLFLTQLGEEALTILAVCLIYWCISKKLAYGVGFAYFTSGLIVNSVKIGCRIDRPWVIDPSFSVVEAAKAKATGYSFPSGHVQGATALYGTLGATVKKKWVINSLLFLCIPIVGFSRMYLGVHTPADVLVGFGITAAIVIVIAVLYFTNGFSDKFFTAAEIVLAVCSAGAMSYALALYLSNTIEFAYAADVSKMAGASVGFVLGCLLERKYVNFRTETKFFWQQIVKAVIGVAVALGLRAGLKALFAVIAPETLAPDAIRYFITVMWAIYIWPALFWRWFKPEDETEALSDK